jgi:hypothetical protein
MANERGGVQGGVFLISIRYNSGGYLSACSSPWIYIYLSNCKKGALK